MPSSTTVPRHPPAAIGKSVRRSGVGCAQAGRQTARLLAAKASKLIRRFARDPLDGDERHGASRHGARSHGLGRRGPHRHGRHRLFDHGDLRFILLRMIADKPAHGYDLIKALEERMGGGYSPSPGVIYPTLTLLEEQGFADVSPEGGKKLYQVTEEGLAFLGSTRQFRPAKQ